MSKRPQASLEVYFVGSGIVPEAIPLATLSRALSAVQRLSLGDDPTADDEVEGDGSLRLVDVKRGSAAFPCVSQTPDRALTNLRLAGRALSLEDAEEKRSPRTVTLDSVAYAFTPIEDLSAIARKLGCKIVVRTPGRDGAREVLATIEPETYARVARNLLITGETTITGRVERVGGATEMRCALRVPFQPNLLYCGVDTPQAVQKLAQRLYDDVVVSGEVRWIRSSWRIVGFTVKDVLQPKKGGVREAFDALREAGGKGWDRVKDPRALIGEGDD